MNLTDILREGLVGRVIRLDGAGEPFEVEDVRIHPDGSLVIYHAGGTYTFRNPAKFQFVTETRMMAQMLVTEPEQPRRSGKWR